MIRGHLSLKVISHAKLRFKNSNAVISQTIHNIGHAATRMDKGVRPQQALLSIYLNICIYIGVYLYMCPLFGACNFSGFMVGF